MFTRFGDYLFPSLRQKKNQIQKKCVLRFHELVKTSYWYPSNVLTSCFSLIHILLVFSILTTDRKVSM